MTTVKITSNGTLVKTVVTKDGVVLDDVVGLRLYFEPGIAQVACEMNYLEEGRLKRWTGVNEGDAFEFTMSAEHDGTIYDVCASTSSDKTSSLGLHASVGNEQQGYSVMVPIFRGASVVLDLMAEGFSLQASAKCELKASPELELTHV